MKKICIVIALFGALTAGAQVKKAVLQASGLTCSMCSNAINKSLQSLPFVASVNANIKNSSFEITFKDQPAVDFDLMKKKVEDAGFFVAALSATINFENKAIEHDAHVVVDGSTFHFLNATGQVLNGETTVRIIDKGFVPAREYRKNSSLTSMACYKTGFAATCCEKEDHGAGRRVFHVTI